MEHEQVHVDNAAANCKGLKKCLDDEVANNIFSETNSAAEYINCHNTHNGGVAESCALDEKAAYKKTVDVGERLVTESRCTGEKSYLEANIKKWKKYAKAPPNCS